MQRTPHSKSHTANVRSQRQLRKAPEPHLRWERKARTVLREHCSEQWKLDADVDVSHPQRHWGHVTAFYRESTTGAYCTTVRDTASTIANWACITISFHGNETCISAWWLCLLSSVLEEKLHRCTSARGLEITCFFRPYYHHKSLAKELLAD